MSIIVSAFRAWDLKPSEHRSPKWPAARKAWLAEHSACAATGLVSDLEVHHKQSFHEHPERELDWDNLITLTEHSTFNAHLWLGHRGNWHDINPRVEEYAAIMLDMLKSTRANLFEPTWKLQLAMMVQAFANRPS